jgi:hypothetical protein
MNFSNLVKLVTYSSVLWSLIEFVRSAEGLFGPMTGTDKEREVTERLQALLTNLTATGVLSLKSSTLVMRAAPFLVSLIVLVFNAFGVFKTTTEVPAAVTVDDSVSAKPADEDAE